MAGVGEAFGIIFSIWALACLLADIAIGIVVGALPGLGPSIGISLLIPFVYALSPELSTLLLVSLSMGAEYGGSISAILLSTPGTAAATATVLDDYAMTQKGRANEAALPRACPLGDPRGLCSRKALRVEHPTGQL